MVGGVAEGGAASVHIGREYGIKFIEHHGDNVVGGGAFGDVVGGGEEVAFKTIFGALNILKERIFGLVKSAVITFIYEARGGGGEAIIFEALSDLADGITFGDSDFYALRARIGF